MAGGRASLKEAVQLACLMEQVWRRRDQEAGGGTAKWEEAAGGDQKARNGAGKWEGLQDWWQGQDRNAFCLMHVHAIHRPAGVHATLVLF